MADYLAENQCPKCGKKLNTGFKCEVCDTMADKEERICICKLEGNATESVCGGSITRQKAIEVMAKAICRQDNLLESCEHCITQCDKEKQKNMCEHILKKRKDNIEPSYFDQAEAALNAFLER